MEIELYKYYLIIIIIIIIIKSIGVVLTLCRRISDLFFLTDPGPAKTLASNVLQMTPKPHEQRTNKPKLTLNEFEIGDIFYCWKCENKW